MKKLLLCVKLRPAPQNHYVSSKLGHSNFPLMYGLAYSTFEVRRCALDKDLEDYLFSN